MPISSFFGVDGIHYRGYSMQPSGAHPLMRDEPEGGGDLATADQLQPMLLAGRVEESAADHQRGRAAAVEVDRRPPRRARRIASASSAMVRPASSSARPSQTAAISSPLSVSPERGPRIAAGGDVGVELAASRPRSPRRSWPGADQRAAGGEQHRARLQQVAGGLGWEVGAGCEADPTVRQRGRRRAERPMAPRTARSGGRCRRFAAHPAAGRPVACRSRRPGRARRRSARTSAAASSRAQARPRGA